MHKDMMMDPNEVHIWFADLNVQADKDDFINFLSQDEYERSCQFAFPYLKNRFIASRAILRLILSEYIKKPAESISFFYGEYGKPILTENNAIKFNLSHSDGWAAYAISFESDVGVDIERIREDIYSVSMEELCLSIGELELLAKLPYKQRIHTFYSLWTYKEALLKGLGCGLEYPLSELEIDISQELEPKIKSHNLSEWVLHPLICPNNFRSAVAIKGKNKKPTFKEWKGGRILNI